MNNKVDDRLDSDKLWQCICGRINYDMDKCGNCGTYQRVMPFGKKFIESVDSGGKTAAQVWDKYRDGCKLGMLKDWGPDTYNMNYTSNIYMHVPVLRYLASRARCIIELGLETGMGSTKAFAEGFAMNPDRLAWVGVDKDLSQLKFKPEEERLFLLEGDTTSQEMVQIAWEILQTPIRFEERKITITPQSPDLIFIDTHHTVEQMTKELAIWKMLSDADTTWVFHDTWMEGHYNPMTDVIKQFAAERGLRYLDYSRENNGLGMVFK